MKVIKVYSMAYISFNFILPRRAKLVISERQAFYPVTDAALRPARAGGMQLCIAPADSAHMHVHVEKEVHVCLKR